MVSCWYIQSQTSRATRISLTSIHRYSELKTGKYDDQMLFLCVLCKIKAKWEAVCGQTIKFVNSSQEKCYIPHCWIPPWSPSKYFPWEAMHRCQHPVHHSKQFWNWFCGMAFRAAIVLLLMSSVTSKCLPFNISFIFRNRKKSLGGGLDPVNRQGVPTRLLVLWLKTPSQTVPCEQVHYCDARFVSRWQKFRARFCLTFSRSLSSTSK